ncbi:SMC-Scp complex subunit ScpB [PVC group bacterium (ex Bugula neritina AB1)]|nr:SMC-Scp complex subunit ScpB [PVC group bacterium (ex Bugula neritina AB1)]
MNDLNVRLKAVLEAFIFSSQEPVSFKHIQKFYPDLKEDTFRMIIKEINDEYKASFRPFHIVELAMGWVLVTREEFSDDLKKMHKHTMKMRLSKAALETLAVIAYKQPITKIEIEKLRGVDSVHMLKNLLKRKLICMNGRKDVPGCPILYVTTDQFLRHFGLKHLQDLPRVDEFVKVVE